MTDIPIKIQFVKSLSTAQPSRIVAVKADGDTNFSLWVTDKTGIPYPIKDNAGGGITAIQNTDGNLIITGTTTKTINVAPALLSLINSALQSGDNISELTNDANYITLADIPTFVASDYDLEDFTNTSLDPFIRQSDVVAGVTNLSYTASPTQGTILSDTGNDAVIPLADATNAGLLSPAEKAELATALQPSDITNLVPYTGATTNVDLGEYQLKTGQLEFDQTPTGTFSVGKIRWNDAAGTAEIRLKGNSVTLQLGQELVKRVVNKTATNITLQESNYQVVRIIGATGQRLSVDLAQANSEANSASTLGLVTENIANNQEGFITFSGEINLINTTGSLQGETWIDGDVLYLSPTVAGGITKVAPTAPDHTVRIGYVQYAHITQGKIHVDVDRGYSLENLHNVKITATTAGKILGSTIEGLWENKTIPDALGYTPENVANKQNSLVVDGTGAKYPTVDAISNGTEYKRTIAQIRLLSGILPNNNFYTTDLGQEGNWYYDATDTTSTDNTGTILVTADGKRIKRVLNGMVFPEWFGAKGDGVTDDTASIQNALNSPIDLFFKDKTYLISSKITLSVGKKVTGTKKTLIKIIPITGQAAFEITAVNFIVDCVNIEAIKTWYPRTDLIANQPAYDNYWNNRTTGGYGISITGKDGVVKNCEVSKTTLGIINQFSENITVDNCYVHETMADAFSIYHGAKKIRIINCLAVDNGDDAYAVYSSLDQTAEICQDITIANNKSYNCYARAYLCHGGKNVVFDSNTSYNSRLSALRIQGNDDVAYNVQDCYNVKAVNNIFYLVNAENPSVTFQLYVTKSHDVTIENNSFIHQDTVNNNSQMFGVINDSDNVSVIDNFLNGDGVQFNNVNYLTMSNNKLLNVNTRVARIYGGSNVIFNDNISQSAKNATENLVAIGGVSTVVSNININGNIIEDNTKTIYVFKANNISIDANQKKIINSDITNAEVTGAFSGASLPLSSIYKQGVKFFKTSTNQNYVNGSTGWIDYLDSPAFTGTPTAPTAASSTNTTQIATTAFVKSLVPTNLITGTGTVNNIAKFTSGGIIGNSNITDTGSLVTVNGLSSFVGVAGSISSFDIQNGNGNGSILVGADVNASTRTNGIRKLARFTTPSFSDITKNHLVFAADFDSSLTSRIYLGGTPGASTLGCTDINFVTVPTNGDTGGIIRMQVKPSGNILIGTTTDDTINLLQVPTGTVSSGSLTSGNMPPTANNHLTRKDYVDLKAPLANPTFTGTPTAPTAAPGTNTTQIANMAALYAATTTELAYALSDETSNLTVGTLIKFRMPFAMTLSEVRISLNDAPTISSVIVDVKENGVSIFSTLLSIDTNEKTSVTAATPAVISDVNLADDAEITISTTQIGSGDTGKGLKILFKGRKA